MGSAADWSLTTEFSVAIHLHVRQVAWSDRVVCRLGHKQMVFEGPESVRSLMFTG